MNEFIRLLADDNFQALTFIIAFTAIVCTWLTHRGK